MKAKDLGANCYCLTGCIEKDTSVILTIRTYFSFDSFFKFNENKKQKDSAFLFSYTASPRTSQYFYCNDSLISFLSTSYSSFAIPDSNRISLKACSKTAVQFLVMLG